MTTIKRRPMLERAITGALPGDFLPDKGGEETPRWPSNPTIRGGETGQPTSSHEENPRAWPRLLGYLMTLHRRGVGLVKNFR